MIRLRGPYLVVWSFAIAGLWAAMAPPAVAQGVASDGVRLQVDLPFSGQTLRPPFIIYGWAVDTLASAGTGIDVVNVRAIPVLGGASVTLGSAQLGIQRPDLVPNLGNQGLLAGFRLDVSAALPAAGYLLEVTAHRTAGNVNFVTRVPFSVGGLSLSDLTPCAAGQVPMFDGAVWVCSTRVGPEGPRGADGNTGAQGNRGDTGLRGPAGPQVLTVRDSSGRAVGDVSAVVVNTAYVVIRIGATPYVFSVSGTQIRGTENISFTSTNCSGAPLFLGADTSPLTRTAVVNSSTTQVVYVPIPGGTTETMTVRSFLQGDGTCSVSTQTESARPAAVITTLTFRPPFTVE